MNVLRFPQIRLEASSHCQLRCPSCPVTTGEVRKAIPKAHLKFEDFESLLKRTPHLRRIELSNYGELFLNPDLLKIMALAQKRKVSLSANNGTNFLLPRDEVLEGLVKYRFASLLCSIDGASQQSYSQYRIGGSFERAIENVAKLNQYKRKYRSRYPKLTWQFIVFEHNVHEIEKARQWAKKLKMGFETKLSWDENLSPLKKDASTSREKYREKVGRDPMRSICYQLWNSPQFNSDGRSLGCCRNFWGDFGGNLFRDGLIPAANSEKMRYARKMLLGKVPMRNDIPCSSCDLYLTAGKASDFISIWEIWAERLHLSKITKRYFTFMQNVQSWRSPENTSAKRVESFHRPVDLPSDL